MVYALNSWSWERLLTHHSKRSLLIGRFEAREIELDLELASALHAWPPIGITDVLAYNYILYN